MPTVPLLSEETVLEMRRLCREDGWTILRIVEHFKTDKRATSRAIRGSSFAKLPGAVPDALLQTAIPDAVVIEMRRLCTEEGWNLVKCVEHFQSDPRKTSRAVRGITHRHIPNPVPRGPLGRHSEETVIEMRRLCREDGVTHVEIAKRFGVSVKDVNSVIAGRTYKHLPGAYKREPKRFTDDQVVEIRRLYREENWRQDAIAAYMGSPATVISAVVRGFRYSHLPGAHQKPQGSVPDDIVLAMRAFYRDHPGTTQNEISDRFGVNRPVGMSILTGACYRHLPLLAPRDCRRFSHDQVTEMRFLYADGYSLSDIGGFYHCNAKTAGGIISGRFYSEIPGHVQLRRKGGPRRLTDEQVSMARRMFRTRYVSGPQIARELGVGGSIYHVIRGRCYKDIPNPVPQHIVSIRRGVTLGPRKAQLSSEAEVSAARIDVAV